MDRLQLFEFEDLPWFPDVFRRSMTRYLKSVVNRFALPALWAEKLAALAPREGPFEIVDLGSGSGGAMESIVGELRRRGIAPQVTLTDLYPQPDALANSPAGIRYWPASVDATRVPGELRGARTMLLSFHHHPPERARAILKDAFEKGVPIAVFEFSAREPAMIATCFLVPFIVLLVTPTIRPLKLSQLFFTYLIPVLPFFMFWDALVSHLRSYSPDDLQRLVGDMKSQNYVWETGQMKVRGMAGSFPWITGKPLASDSGVF